MYRILEMRSMAALLENEVADMERFAAAPRG
jgi:hypothetical protein